MITTRRGSWFRLITQIRWLDKVEVEPASQFFNGELQVVASRGVELNLVGLISRLEPKQVLLVPNIDSESGSFRFELIYDCVL